jgi:hydrogenase expression/formation protein HypE
MSAAPAGDTAGIGKVSGDVFRDVIFPHLGATRGDVLVGPRHGVDIGIVALAGDQVMAITTDPFFVVPEYGWERAAWFAVHILASDAATSGLRPSYMSVDLNLPHSMTDAELALLWEATSTACADLGIAVVAGHTGRYDNCDYPMLGGATVMAVGPARRYVTPAMARPGDAIVVTKGPAIETTALFGVTFPHLLSQEIGPELARAAEDLFYRMSVVDDATTAVEIGVRDRGVTAMHDATERGVLGGLVEIGEAAGVGLVVDLDALAVPPEVAAVCDLFGIDPYSTSSEGSLLLTCRPAQTGRLIDHLAAGGIPAYRVGEILPAEAGMQVVHRGLPRPLEAPHTDPFWPAYQAARERYLS